MTALKRFSKVTTFLLLSLSLLLHSKTSAYPIITDVDEGDTKVGCLIDPESKAVDYYYSRVTQYFLHAPETRVLTM